MSHPKYIVTFADGVDLNEHIKNVESNGGKITHDYRPLMNSFAAEIPPSYFSSFQSLQSPNGPIESIEPDSVFTTQ